MVAEKSPDWLPAGWTVQVKVKNGRKVRCYFNGETGQKFHSKSDIIRYVKMGNVRIHQPINKHKKRPSKKKAVPLAAKTNEYPEWLPHGWTMEVKTRKAGSRIGMKYKCYIDPSTGCKFFSKPEVTRYLKSAMCDDSTSKQKKIDIGSVSNHCNDQLNGGKSSLKPELSQNLKTIKGKSFTSKQKKESIDKHSVKNVVVERVPPDGLPPGWIKEIRIQKKVNGIRKDPYYTDPVSGYVFRSQKDALRYLETGDINRCAIKPKKRDVNDVEMKNDELSPQSVGKGHKLRHHTTRRQLFAGKESFDTSSLAASDAEGSKDGQRKAVCTDVIGTSTLTAEILEGKHLIDNVIGDNAETKEGPDPSSSALPKTKGSKRKRGKRTLAEDGSVSTPAANILQEENLPENGTEEFSNRRTQIGSSKCKNKNALILPSRSSKRLAGLKPELVANLGLSERALRAATKKSGESENKPSLGFTLDGEADGALQQLEAEPEIEIAHHASGGTEAPLDVEPPSKNEKSLGDQAVPEEQPRRQESEKKDDKNPDPSDVDPSNKNEKPPGGQAVPEEQPGRQVTEKKDDENPESQVFPPFGDSWSDPCLDFAFKTLTGAIPVEDNLAIQGYFRQQVDTSERRDGGSTLLDFVLPSSFQNDISAHFDAPEKPLCPQQLLENPTFLPPGNVSLPSCSGSGPQQPSLDVNKEYQAKVN